jgi:hypothetical protein
MSRGEDETKVKKFGTRALLYAIISIAIALSARSMRDWLVADPAGILIGKTILIRVPIWQQIYFCAEVFAIAFCALMTFDAFCHSITIPLRLRFSLRTLGISVAMTCVYLGAWDVTKKYGEKKHVDAGFLDESSPAPFIIAKSEHDIVGGKDRTRYRYYLWLFGPKIKLPVHSTWRK